MFFPHISLIIPTEIVSQYNLSSFEDTDKLKFVCKTGQYTSINNIQGDNLETYHNGISSSLANTNVYVTKSLVRREFEYNSATTTETLYPLDYLYLLEDLVSLPTDEVITVHDYVRPEKIDRSQGYTIREGRIHALGGEVKSLANLPTDYYTNPSRTRWEGTKWTTINFKFSEQKVREI